MKKNITLILFALLASVIFFAWLNKHILFLSPFSTQKVKIRKIRKKRITIFYYQQKEKQELVSILWPQTTQEQLSTIVTGWLVFLKKEQVISRDIYLDTILVDSQDQTAYLSFNCHFLQAFEPTGQKLHLLESLFKTISANQEPTFANNGHSSSYTAQEATAARSITKIMLLVNHKPMQDDFLDFSQVWPIT